MPRKTLMPITGSVLQWAIDESGYSEAELAERVGVDVDKLRAWADDVEQPSKSEFTRLVQALRRPSALFFRESPPATSSTMADFRRVPGLAGHELVENEVRALRRVKQLQDLASWVLRERGVDQVNLPQFSPRTTNPERAGRELRKLLGPTFRQQLEWGSAQESFKEFRRLLESAGVFALQLEIRKSQLRGFSLWDNYAPVAVVKSGYNYPSRNYTLFHEVGHLVTRSRSACHGFVDPDDPDDPAIERWCERFAAAYLLPRKAVASTLSAGWGVDAESPVGDFDTLMAIAAEFKVSGRALAIHLTRQGLAVPNMYDVVSTRAKVVDLPEDGFARGGKRPRKRLREYGSRLPEILSGAAEEGLIGRKDALDHLEVSLAELHEIERLLVED